LIQNNLSFPAGGVVSTANPQLGPLANNGGPTQTLAEARTSPAAGAGNPAKAVDANNNPLTTDQRGFPRLINGLVDIGAFETQPGPGPTPPSQPPLPFVSAFLAASSSGKIAVGGIVFDPDGAVEPHTVGILWGDGTFTLLTLPPASGGVSLFLSPGHKKHRHQTITVAVVDPGVLAELPLLGGIPPHVSIQT
jgi:hypothetical protein